MEDPRTTPTGREAPRADPSGRASALAGRHPSARALGANLALLATRRRALDEVLASVVDPGASVALVNFPNHRNVGDSLLWRGARRALRRIGVRVAYQCAWDTFSHRAMRARIGDGPVLVNGGGNLGDAYRGQQGLREHVLEVCGDNPVVQLPQSTWFRDPSNAVAMGERIAAHGGVTLLLRDRASLAFAHEHLRAADTRFCHDTAFGNEPLTRGPARADVSWITRHDGERSHGLPDDLDGVEVHDWVDTPEGDAGWAPTADRLLAINTAMRGPMSGGDHVAGLAAAAGWAALAATFEPLAEAWIARGVAMASAGRVVVTDRAHGHILALLLGIPSVVLDTANAKVSGIVEASTADSPLTHLATSPNAALALARDLASGRKDVTCAS